MRILLVNPTIISKVFNEESYPEPLSLEYLATIIYPNNEVKILDCAHFKEDNNRILKEIEQFSPSLIGISALYSISIPEVIRISNLIKEKYPDITVVVGGNAATFYTEYILKNSLIDIAVIGEGEITFKELVEYLSNNGFNLKDLDKIDGIAYKVDNTVKFTKQREIIENLDSLPIPHRDLLENKNYYTRTIITSRGCPYGCIYCSTSTFFKKYRERSIDNIISEIEYLYSEPNSYNSNQLIILDDTFVLDKNRVIELCDRLLNLQKNLGLTEKISWNCSGRIENMSFELLKLMKEAGCKTLFFGIESGSNKVLKALKRNYTVEDVKRVINYCNQLNILTKCAFIVGLPYEDKEDLNNTFELISSLNTITVVSMFTPFAGTPVYNSPEKFNIKITSHLPEEDDIDKYSWVDTPYLSREEIKAAYCKAIGLALQRFKYRYNKAYKL